LERLSRKFTGFSLVSRNNGFVVPSWIGLITVFGRTIVDVRLGGFGLKRLLNNLQKKNEIRLYYFRESASVSLRSLNKSSLFNVLSRDRRSRLSEL
jgi:hypothetical protein